MISENVARALRKVRPDFRTAMQGEKQVWIECVMAAGETLCRSAGELARFTRLAGGMSLRVKRLPTWARRG